MLDLNKIIVDYQTGELSEEELIDLYEEGYLNNYELDLVVSTVDYIEEATLNPHTQKIVDEQKKNWEISMANPKNKAKLDELENQTVDNINKTVYRANPGIKHVINVLSKNKFSDQLKHKHMDRMINHLDKANEQVVNLPLPKKAKNIKDASNILNQGEKIMKKAGDPYIKLMQAKALVKKQRAEEAAELARENANKYAQK